MSIEIRHTQINYKRVLYEKETQKDTKSNNSSAIPAGY